MCASYPNATLEYAHFYQYSIVDGTIYDVILRMLAILLGENFVN